MSNIAKISNISIDNIAKIYEIDKNSVNSLMGVNSISSGPSKSYNIDIDNTKIDSDLTNFPLLVNLSNSAGVNSYDLSNIFDTIGSDYSKLKIYDSNNTQLYTEVENWDATNKTAQLWVKVPSVSSSTSTSLTLDYSATAGSNDYISDDPTAKAINLNIDLGSEGTYDTVNLRSPFILKENDTSYKMWYSGHDGSHWRIIYCTSTDGINWSNFQMAVNYNQEGIHDTTNIFHPCVIKESDTSYKMWYGGYDGTHFRILYCTSTDGINWSNHQMVVNYNRQGTYDTTQVYHPFVIKENDTSYKMWYTGRDGSHYRILYCTSTDGINWSNFQMVVNIGSQGTYDINNAQTPSILKESDTSYKLWYSGSSGSNWRILYATSTNGINWSNFQMVLNYNQEGSYDNVNAYFPNVIKENNNSYKMWYSGYDGSHFRILYTTSDNGKDWTKNVVNRVWDDDFAAVYHMSQDPSGGPDCILDSTSNTNHGTPHNISSNYLVDGKIGKALNFDGGNNYINCGHDSSLHFTYTSIEAIINPTGFKTADDGKNTIYHPGSDYCILQVRGDSSHVGKVSFYVGGYYYSTSTIPLDQFSHIIATYGGGYVRIYINGQLDTEVQRSITHSWTSDPAGIGAQLLGGPYRYSKGIIDELKISKTARSADWIKATYYSNTDRLNYWNN